MFHKLNRHAKYEVSISWGSKNITKVKVFRHVGQRSKSLGQNFGHQCKGLITRNAHVKYKSPTSIGSKVMAQFKVVGYMTSRFFGVPRNSLKVQNIYKNV